MSLKVVGVGHTCFDMALGLDALPERGTLGLCTSARAAGGGPCFAGTIALARLGAAARLVAAVGADVMGHSIELLARDAGVDARLIRVDGTTTSCTAVVVNADGERTFLHWPGPNRLLNADQVSDEVLSEADALLVAGLGLIGLDGQPCAALFDRANKLGLYTAIDTVDPGFQDPEKAFVKLARALPLTDLVCISRKEARPFTGSTDPGQICAFLQRHGARLVMVKMGEDGIAFKDGDGALLHVPAFDIVPKDTTGSGDAASAAFLYYAASRRPPLECARFAAAVGAVVAQRGIGAAGTPSAVEAVQFIDRTRVRG